MKHIVVIGGGTGSFTVLSGLKKYTHNISAIVAMSDSGGSTGRLRDELGILPPGDIRACLVALAHPDKLLRDLFNYRFENGSLRGHNFGNIFLAAVEKLTGNFETAVAEAAKILAISGEVIPVTTQATNLFAEIENGQVIKGETNIDKPKHDAGLKIIKVWLEPKAVANPRALGVIKKANLIVIGPGNLYTSIIPNLLVSGIAEAIRKSRARKIYVCNLMTDLGETNGFGVGDFVEVLEKYLGEDCLDCAIYNKAKLPAVLLQNYAKEGKVPVKFDGNRKRNSRVKYLGADLADHKTLIRHNADKLARFILDNCLGNDAQWLTKTRNSDNLIPKRSNKF